MGEYLAQQETDCGTMGWRRGPERRGEGWVGGGIWWASLFPLHSEKSAIPTLVGQLTRMSPLRWLRQGSCSHLLVALSLLQYLEAAVVWLAADGHVRLLLQDVQAEVVAAVQAFPHAQQQASMLLGRNTNIVIKSSVPLCVCVWACMRAILTLNLTPKHKREGVSNSFGTIKVDSQRQKQTRCGCIASVCKKPSLKAFSVQ